MDELLAPHAHAGPEPGRVTGRLPDFVVIGAMKCATSTLHEQLAAQEGVFMSTPKEPCFFSDDDIWERGVGWYTGLFDDAPPGAVCGESSTHYAKLPTHPRAADRMKATLPDVRLIYLMRHPIDRLISHYVHDWSQGRTRIGIDEAIKRFPELVDYGRYAMQLRPWIDAFGPERVLPVFAERLSQEPADELRRAGEFLGVESPMTWRADRGGENRSSDRMRSGVLLRVIMQTPGATFVRTRCVPRSTREWIKQRMFRLSRVPAPSEAAARALRETFDKDLAELSEMLGLNVPLTCDSFAADAVGLRDPRLGRSCRVDEGSSEAIGLA